MIYSYLKIAARNFRRHASTSFIKLVSLSVGLASFILFLAYSLHEFNFDQFHPDGERIYRMYRWTENIYGRGTEGDPHLPMPLGIALKEEFPDVEEVVRWKEAWGENLVRVGNSSHKLEVSHADPKVFEVFDFSMMYGTPSGALADAFSVVITKPVAQQLFGEDNPTGKEIEIRYEDEFEKFTVAGVTEAIPSNSSKQFEIMGSMDYFAQTDFGQRRSDNWGSSFLTVFVKLREGSGLATNAEALLNFRRNHYPDYEASLRESGVWSEAHAPVTYALQAIADMHTDPAIRGGDVPAVAPQSIYLLLWIAGGVLLIALINYTTLAVGRSARRASEVGVRKVVGSLRIQLFKQFLVESFFFTFLGVGLACPLAYYLLPFFNRLAGRELSLDFVMTPQFGLGLLALVLISGSIAGMYPALVLSGLRPAEILKGKTKLGGSNIFTKCLVTTQFVLSVGLIIAVLIMTKQLNFLRNSSPGFNSENVLVVDANDVASPGNYELFKTQAQQHPDILRVAGAEQSFGADMGWSRHGFDYEGENKQIYSYFVLDDFLDVMKMDLVAGRNFDPARNDRVNRSVIVNESFLREFGWSSADALGKKLDGYFEEDVEPEIIGVVRDFNFRSFRENIDPQLFHQFDDYDPRVYVCRLAAGDPEEPIAHLRSVWSELVPEVPLSYSFVDQDMDRFYRSEERLSQIVSSAAALSILLACLGLLGLASLSAANRRKEIGIRKVLGASATQIVRMLSQDYIKLVLLSLVVAIPLVWVLMHNWLQNFAFRTEMSWWIFAAAGLVSIVLAVSTLSIQGFWSARVDPVQSIRDQ